MSVRLSRGRSTPAIRAIAFPLCLLVRVKRSQICAHGAPAGAISKCATVGHLTGPVLIETFHPCLCLCRGFTQSTLTTPRRLTTLHFAQIGLTEDFTFILENLAYLNR